MVALARVPAFQDRGEMFRFKKLESCQGHRSIEKSSVFRSRREMFRVPFSGRVAGACDAREGKDLDSSPGSAVAARDLLFSSVAVLVCHRRATEIAGYRRRRFGNKKTPGKPGALE